MVSREVFDEVVRKIRRGSANHFTSENKELRELIDETANGEKLHPDLMARWKNVEKRLPVGRFQVSLDMERLLAESKAICESKSWRQPKRKILGKIARFLYLRLFPSGRKLRKEMDKENYIHMLSDSLVGHCDSRYQGYNQKTVDLIKELGLVGTIESRGSTGLADFKIMDGKLKLNIAEATLPFYLRPDYSRKKNGKFVPVDDPEKVFYSE